MLNEIKEIQTLKEALAAIGPDTWLVLDLDNTVMESMIELGGDAWFVTMMGLELLQTDNNRVTEVAMVAIYHALQSHVRTQIVEPEIVSLIQERQRQGVPVYALTSRDYAIRYPTIRQLADNDIDFSPNAIPNERHLCYANGIIFCNDMNNEHGIKRDKGYRLKQFLQHFAAHHGNLPRHIVMLDDSLKHLQHVQAALQPLGIEFNGFRYGFCDEKSKKLDLHKTNAQLAYIKHKLPWTVQMTIDQTPFFSRYPSRFSPSQFAHGFFQHTPESRWLPRSVSVNDEVASAQMPTSPEPG